MVIGIIGESCVGKSTLAQALQQRLGAELLSGKDYLRLAKSESEATALFQRKLATDTGLLIYVASETEQAALLPPDAVRVLVTAPLGTIKERFRLRMHGNLPRPVEQMLEKKHGLFDAGEYTLRFDSTRDELSQMCEAVVQKLSV